MPGTYIRWPRGLVAWSRRWKPQNHPQVWTQFAPRLARYAFVGSAVGTVITRAAGWVPMTARLSMLITFSVSLGCYIAAGVIGSARVKRLSAADRGWPEVPGSPGGS